ncbi:hypothetical protein ACLXBB_33605, partial [Pseudomonas aeruginosa]
ATAGRTDRGTELRMSLGNLVAVVFGLAFGGALREASAEELIAWAARFNREAYRQRLAALIEELS